MLRNGLRSIRNGLRSARKSLKSRLGLERSVEMDTSVHNILRDSSIDKFIKKQGFKPPDKYDLKYEQYYSIAADTPDNAYNFFIVDKDSNKIVHKVESDTIPIEDFKTKLGQVTRREADNYIHNKNVKKELARLKWLEENNMIKSANKGGKSLRLKRRKTNKRKSKKQRK